MKVKVGDLVRYKNYESRSCGLVVTDDTPTVGFVSFKVQWASGLVATYGSQSLEDFEVINNAS